MNSSRHDVEPAHNHPYKAIVLIALTETKRELTGFDGVDFAIERRQKDMGIMYERLCMLPEGTIGSVRNKTEEPRRGTLL